MAPTNVTQDAHVVNDNGSDRDPEKMINEEEQKAADEGNESDGVTKQEGVRQVEAITSVWDKKMLWTVFGLLYLVSFVDSLLLSVQGSLTPYVTSAFAEHSLLSTASIVSTLVGGVCQLTIAKIIDVWGRVEGFVLMILFIIVGMILMATCNGVEMYAAASTIYWVGHIGLLYIISVMLADMTTLQNRLIMFGINATPLIATTFAGPNIAELFLTTANFRWAFGAFTIILVVFSIPVIVIFFMAKQKALRLGVLKKKERTRSYLQSIIHYAIEFDAFGLLLTTAGWALLLLPFSIASIAPKGWASGYIIAMIVLGVFLLTAFVFWEIYGAPVPFFPWNRLKDRTILGACLLYGIMFLSIYVWDTYYGTYLQVVHDQSVSAAGYIGNAMSLSSAFIGPIVGLVIKFTNEYKWTSMSGIPLVILGTALLIHFRTAGTGVGYLVMCQLFIGFGTGIWGLSAQIAIMANVKHQEIAVAIAMWGLFGSIGASVGNTVAGALWTNIVPEKLYAALPDDSKNLTATLYGDITQQLAYPMGDPVRMAIISAFDDVQRKMVIIGACFVPLMLASILIWRNKNLKQEQEKAGQSKGTIF